MNRYLFLVLLFGLQVLVAFNKRNSNQDIVLTIKNNKAVEIIEGQVNFSLNEILKIRPSWKIANVQVFSENKPVKSALVDHDGDGNYDTLLALVDFKPNEAKTIQLVIVNHAGEINKFENQAARLSMNENGEFYVVTGLSY